MTQQQQTPFESILTALLNQGYGVTIEKDEGLIFFKIEGIRGQWTGEDLQQLSGVLIEGMIHTSLSRIDGGD